MAQPREIKAVMAKICSLDWGNYCASVLTEEGKVVIFDGAPLDKIISNEWHQQDLRFRVECYAGSDPVEIRDIFVIAQEQADAVDKTGQLKKASSKGYFRVWWKGEQDDTC